MTVNEIFRTSRTMVLDDDPTGTQSAANVTVLLDHDVDALAEVLASESSVYVQTNSRALDEESALALATSIRAAAESVGQRLGAAVRFVLRGDSTLRGHVFSESSVFMDDDAVMLFVPAFPDGGRVTRDGIHRVRQGDSLVPVDQTEYAQDPVFSFETSDLVEFVRVKSGRSAILVSLPDVRAGRLAGVLADALPGTVVLADAETNADISLIAQSVEEAWTRRPVIVRAAAPLAAALAGVTSNGYLDDSSLRGHGRALVVCGSHTDGARAQLGALSRTIGKPTVIDTARALDDPSAEGLRIAGIEQSVRRPSSTYFIATERDRSVLHGSLLDGARVMEALLTAARELARTSDVVITKGGITSAEVIRSALGARRARVLGQLQAGVSAWSVSAADGREIPCIIVPGNMGDDDVLNTALAWAEGAK